MGKDIHEVTVGYCDDLGEKRSVSISIDENRLTISQDGECIRLPSWGVAQAVAQAIKDLTRQ